MFDPALHFLIVVKHFIRGDDEKSQAWVNRKGILGNLLSEMSVLISQLKLFG